MDIPINPDVGLGASTAGIVLSGIMVLVKYRQSRQETLDTRTSSLLDRYATELSQARDALMGELRAHAESRVLSARFEGQVVELTRRLDHLEAEQVVRPIRRKETS